MNVERVSGPDLLLPELKFVLVPPLGPMQRMTVAHHRAAVRRQRQLVACSPLRGIGRWDGLRLGGLSVIYDDSSHRYPPCRLASHEERFVQCGLFDDASADTAGRIVRGQGRGKALQDHHTI